MIETEMKMRNPEWRVEQWESNGTSMYILILLGIYVEIISSWLQTWKKWELDIKAEKLTTKMEW